MSLIFLSHSSVDELEAVALKQWLLDNGWDDVFLDLDPERGLRAGERWQEALRRTADRCEAVVFIISPAWAKSKWCLTEFLLAKSLNKLIFGVVVKETQLSELPTELTAEYQLTHLIGKGSTETIHFVHNEQPIDFPFLANGLGRLRFGLQTAGLSASFFPWPPEDDKLRAPYRGLEPLDKNDAAVFFGRDAEILQGLDRLRGMRTAGDEGLFIILGPSGSGKSSFLRAGLLPRLARYARYFYPLEIIRPERSPLYGGRGLANAIFRANEHLRLMPANLGEVKMALDGDAERLGQLLLNIQNVARYQLLGLLEDAPSPTLILPVDQAEELFNADASEQARRFLALIGGVLRAGLPGGGGPSLSLVVVFTIRSDRYEPLQTAPQLMGLKTVVFDALKPMPMAQFKEVITGPAVRAASSSKRLEIKPDLVQQLLADSEQGGDTLPLLSLALSRLYRDYSSDGDLRLDEYQAMGGISNVIRTEIESILSPDPETQKAQLEILHTAFIPWLATINSATINLEKSKPMRRVARMADLPPASHTLVKALIEKRLLLSDMRDGEQVVEVTHESLLRQWDILVKWLETEEDDLKEADRLEQAAGAWNRSSKKSDWLVEGERLTIWETLAAKPGYRRRLETTAEFLQCSRQRETQRREAEERQSKAELIAAQEKQRAAQEKQVAAEEQQRITVQLAEAERKRTEMELLAASDREAAADALATEQLQATERAQADSARLRKRADQLLVTVLGALILAGAASYGFYKAAAQRRIAESSQVRANGLRLAAESQAMMMGARPGGEERAILQLLAGSRTAPSDEIESLMLAALLRNQNTQKIIVTPVTILSVAFSPDGTRIVSGGANSTPRLWDTKSGAPIGAPPQEGNEQWVMSVAFSMDGMRIVSGGTDKMLRLWDAKSGAPIGAPLQGHKEFVTSVAFSPDGTRLVSGSADKTLRLWDSKSGEPIGAPLQGHGSLVTSVAFSPDGTRLISGSDDTTVRLWDAKSGQPIGLPLYGHELAVMTVGFSPDGTRIASGGADSTLRLWDGSSGKPISTLQQGHESTVTSVAFSPDGTRLVSGGDDNMLYLWDAKSGAPIGAPLEGHTNKVTSVGFSPDGKSIVSSSWDKTIRLRTVGSASNFGTLLEGDKSWESVAFSPDGTRILSGSNDGTTQLWDVESSKPIGIQLQGDEKTPISVVALRLDGKRSLTGHSDGTLQLWDAASGRPIGARLQGHQMEVLAVAFSPDGMRIVSASKDKTVRLWNALSGKLVCEPLQRHSETVTSVAFSPDSMRILLGQADGTLQLCDAKNGELIGAPLLGNKDWVSSVAFSPDGGRIVSGSAGGITRLWDARSWAAIGVPEQGHEDVVSSIAFSPDGAWFVSGSRDATLRLWDGTSGKPIGVPLKGHESNVTSTAFSPDGTRIVSGSADNTLRLWPAPKVWADLLCAKLTRNMSHVEWLEWVSPTIPSYTEQCPGLPISANKLVTGE